MTNQAAGQRMPLSAIIKNGRARAAFQRSERDQGPEPLATVILPPERPTPLDGATAVNLSPEERQRIERQIEWALDLAELLTAVLDASEPDADLEPCCEDEGACETALVCE